MREFGFAFVVLSVVLLAGCKTGPETVDSNGLQITDVVVGQGESAAQGMKVTVHYRGTLDDGTVFDSSLLREPLTFKLGVRQVIRGWDMGIAGMRVGGKRHLIIPPELAYGNKTHGSIPPGSTLSFDVELKALSR